MGSAPPQSAPIRGANSYIKYEKGTHYFMNKDACANIKVAEEGAASDKKDGLPPTTVPALLKIAAERHPNRVALRQELDADGNIPPLDAKNKAPPSYPKADWKTWTWKEYKEDCDRLALSLINLGVKQFGTVAIWGFNSPQWVISSFGSMTAGAKTAGIYPTDKPDAVKFKCFHSSADVMVLEDKKKFDVIKSIASDLPDLKAVVTWGFDSKETEIECKEKGTVRVFTWEAFLDLSKEVKEPETVLKQRFDATKPGHCCALIYTSGTTGKPKAVMTSHDNFLFATSAAYQGLASKVGAQAGVPERIISYLPLSHIAGMTGDLSIPLWVTSHTDTWFEVYFARPYDLKFGSIRDRIQSVKPTVFGGVPRVWEKIAEAIQAKGASLTSTQKKISAWGKGIGLTRTRELQVGGTGEVPCCNCLAVSIVQKKVRAALGLDEMKFGVTGAAPMGRHTLEYYGSLGIVIYEGYGMSESTGITTMSMDGCFLWGSCGYPSPGCEVKCFKVDEKDISKKTECPKAAELFHPTEEEQGELCFRGRHVMLGYLANPALGQEHVELIKSKNEGAIDSEGWLHSGDKGAIGKNGFVRITGRYKELIIGSGGENIAPVPIENNVKKVCKAISNIMMFGDKKKFNIALVTLKTVGATGIEPGSDDLMPTALFSDVEVSKVSQAIHERDYVVNIEKALIETNKNGDVCPSNASRIAKFTILPVDFSVETGEFTSTLKMKRSVIAKKYKDIINKMYEVKSRDAYVPFSDPPVTKEPSNEGEPEIGS